MTNEQTLIINTGGTKRWYLNRKLHREDGPAIEFTDGSKLWYKHGEYHRVDGPAEIGRAHV